MLLLRFENVSLAFGEAPILDKASLQIDEGERIFLIGRNGMGKSCLLKLISGEYKPDDGKIHRKPELKVAGLSQSLLERGSATIYEVVAEGLEETGNLLKEYHSIINKLNKASTSNTNGTESNGNESNGILLKKLEEVQQKIEAKNAWDFENRIANILTQLELPADKPMNQLSGGWQRRVDLARALVSQPDLLLLDEPTNHLDLLAIEWLEEYLRDYPGTVLTVTHDRALLRKLSKRILELDRGKLTSWMGDYDKYLMDKEHRLEVEAVQAEKFDAVLAQEEAWIRQGIKARRTRNEGRVRALKKLRAERQKRREVQGGPKFSANEGIMSGDLVVKAENIDYSIPLVPQVTQAISEGAGSNASMKALTKASTKASTEASTEALETKPIIKDFSIKIFRGDKIALVGPNGVGKSTLLKILLGELTPERGSVVLGSNLEIGYFDQLRAGINFSLSAVENVAGGREFIMVNGKSKHIISYLSDFLFTPERARTPVSVLSGGECNRLLLAKLFSLPTNLLVLDEPTNDLDIESLELLESLLVDYNGTILLVSHDRSFVDEVATSTLYFAGAGNIKEFVGGYSDIPEQILKQGMHLRHASIPTESPTTRKSSEAKKGSETKSSSESLDSRRKRELADLPGKIDKLEKMQQELQHEMSKPDFYKQDKEKIAKTTEAFKKNELAIRELYKRWEELE